MFNSQHASQSDAEGNGPVASHPCSNSALDLDEVKRFKTEFVPCIAKLLQCCICTIYTWIRRW